MGNSIAKAREKGGRKRERVVHQRKPTVEHWLCDVCKKNRIRTFIDIYPGVGTGSKQNKVCNDCYEEYTTCDGCLQKFTYENTFNCRGYRYQDHWYCSLNSNKSTMHNINNNHDNDNYILFKDK